MGLLGWLIFLLALCVSIMVHETGHFVTAKRYGMKATRYFLGFGPTLWSTRRGETEYGIKALPLGGFVKIIGMHSLDDDHDPLDEPRSFRRQPGWQRLIVLYAGIAMNFVLAFVLVAVLSMTVGIENDNTTQIGTVASCVAPTVADLNNQICASSKQPSPAKLAGLEVGDTITSFNGKKVRDWTQLTNAIKAVKPGSDVTMTVLRDGKPKQLNTTKAAKVPGRSGAYIGITSATVFHVSSPLGAVKEAGSFYGLVFSASGHAISGLPSAASKLFSKQRSNNPNDQLCSVICAGQQTSQAIAANVGWRSKAELVVLLTAELNIFLGLGNILPLMPFDGGLAAVIIWERIRAWFARLRGRPDPGLVDIRKLLPAMFSLFMIVVVFFVILMLADIVNPVKLGQ